MKKIFILTTFLYLLSGVTPAQSPGVIYKPAGNQLGKLILNPNGDGLVSASGVTWSTNGMDYGTQSELNMIPLPVLALETDNDLSTGSGGGITDIVRNTGDNTHSQSVYVLARTVGGIEYLIVRFRIGKASNSPKGYSLLIDTDGDISGTGKNPGFEKEIVLRQTRDVTILTHNVSNGTSVESKVYDLNNHTQFSVAATTVSGTTDFFYDFFVPIEDIETTSFIRLAAATVTSANSGITGTISDINGVNDKNFGNVNNALKSLINVFPLNRSFSDLTDPIIGFGSQQTSNPTISSANTTTVTGSSYESDGTSVSVYRGVQLIGTAFVSNNQWTLSSITTLNVGDEVYAKATASGKSESSASSPIVVQAVSICFTPAPNILTRVAGSGKNGVTASWTPPAGTSPSSITVYGWIQSDINTFDPLTVVSTSSNAITVSSANFSNFEFITGIAQNTFNGATILLTAQVNSCGSNYSNASSGNTGTITPFPTITTNTILASINSTSISITNGNSLANIILYVNGKEVTRTSSAVAANGTTTLIYAGFQTGDIVTARAIGTTTGNSGSKLSNVSNSIVVTTNTQTTTPLISGDYTSGSEKTVEGTCDEAMGTVIKLFSGVSEIGSTTVDAFGRWTVSNLTLSHSTTSNANQLTATARANNKNVSNASSIKYVTAPVTAPSITTATIQVGDLSISGSGAQTKVIISVDGMPIDTITASGSWTYNATTSPFYRGATVTANNLVGGVLSSTSNSVTVTGPVSFLITNTSDNSNLGSITAGSPLQLKFTAKDGPNGTGNTIGSFSGTVNVSSTSFISSGGGTSNSFSSGVLGSHNLTLTSSGNSKIIQVFSSQDPTAYGSNSVNINYAQPCPVKSTLNVSKEQIVNTGGDNSTIFVRLYDNFGNEITNSTGINVNFSSSGGVITGITNNGDGTYNCSFSSEVTGEKEITAQIESSTMSTTKSVLVVPSGTTILYSRATGEWNSASTWSQSGHLGGASEFSPREGDLVIIGSGHTVSLIQNITNNNAVYVNNSGKLILSSYTISGSGSFNLVSGGTIEIGSPQGIVTAGASGNIQTSVRNFSSEGRFIYSGSESQSTGAGLPTIIKYLKVNNSNGLTFTNSITITDTLELTSGKITVDLSKDITLGVSTVKPGTLIFNEYSAPEFPTWIVGKFKRYISDMSSENVRFPVGGNAHWAGALVRFNNSKNSGGLIECRYIQGDPGSNNSSTILDNSYEINSYSTYGYWSIHNTNVNFTNYSIELDAYNFDGIKNGSDAASENNRKNIRVLKRENSSSAWVVPGNHNNGKSRRPNSDPHQRWVVQRGNLTEFSEFTLGSNQSDNDLGNNPLPVELTSFIAKSQNGKINLNWQTETEVNNYGFEIERIIKTSENKSNNWEKIGFVNGSGNSNSPKEYSFTDLQLNKDATLNYRLKQIDNDGKFAYSSIIEVEFIFVPNEFSMSQNYPNPFNPNTTIKFGIPVDSKVTLEVYNIIGERVYTIYDNQIMSAGFHEVRFDGTKLSSGAYIYRIQAGEFTSSKKFILMK